MASPKPVSAFVLTWVLLFVFISLSQEDGNAKVEVALYYESLCPYCAGFIVNQLGNMVQTDLFSIVNLRLIPWGNTQRSANSWICQHGRDECVLNIVEACVINVWPNPITHFKVIRCIERLELEGKQSQWQACFASLKLDPKPFTDCFTTRHGIDLELKYADETDRLNPPHRFVPWVLVNNKALQEDFQNFVAYVCKAYTGRSKPAACKRLVEINSAEMENSLHQVCYRGDSKNSTSVSIG